jgi:hypothetical protein
MSPNQDLGEVTIYELVRSLGKFLTLDPNISFDFRPNNASFLVTIADTENGVDSCFEVNFYTPDVFGNVIGNEHCHKQVEIHRQWGDRFRISATASDIMRHLDNFIKYKKREQDALTE